MPSPKYTPQEVQKILEFSKTHSLVETQRKFGVSYLSIKCWSDPLHHQKQLAYLKQDYLTAGQTPARAAYRLGQSKNRKLPIHKPFLEYTYSKEDQIKELNKIIKTPGSYNFAASSNKIMLTHQPHFYEKENELWQSSQIKKRIIPNREKYLFKSRIKLTEKELLRGFKISGIYTGFSHFNPLWIKKFIEDYKPKVIYDPCGGWGHRLLGIVNSDCQYIYNDWDTKTYNGVQNIIKDFNINNAKCYNEDAANFIPTEDFDAVFTCPPYYNIETYNNKEFKSLADYKQWWQKVVNNIVTKNIKYFAFIISNEFEQLLMSAIPSNFRLKEQITLGKKMDHFKRVTSSNKREILIVLEKI